MCMWFTNVYIEKYMKKYGFLVDDLACQKQLTITVLATAKTSDKHIILAVKSRNCIQ